MYSNKPKIVVLGAGYAGMMTTKRLTQKLLPEEADIVLINKHNYHYQTTWLHEVAAESINHHQARVLNSDVINPDRPRLIYDTDVKGNEDENKVRLGKSAVTDRHLVIALGCARN